MFQVPCARHLRSKLYYTASGITTPVGGCPVHRLREDCLNLCRCVDTTHRWLSGAQVERGLSQPVQV